MKNLSQTQLEELEAFVNERASLIRTDLGSHSFIKNNAPDASKANLADSKTAKEAFDMIVRAKQA